MAPVSGRAAADRKGRPAPTRRIARAERDRYRWLGPAYELGCRLYGGHALRRCRLAALGAIAPGERVLFAGAGPGVDALAAHRLGADVTVVDRSATMLRCFERRAGVGRERLRILHADVRELDEAGRHHVVVANFFLNVFSAAEMPRVLAHLARLRAARGRLVIGDFACPGGNLAQRWIPRVYWYAALVPFALLAGNAWHAIHDYRRLLPDLDLPVLEVRRFGALGIDLFWSIVAGDDRTGVPPG